MCCVYFRRCSSFGQHCILSVLFGRFLMLRLTFPFNAHKFSMNSGFHSICSKMLCHSDFYFLVIGFIQLCCMLLIESVFRCLCLVCVYCLVLLLFFLSTVFCISYCTRKKPSDTHTTHKPQTVRQNVLFILCAHFYYHCYAFSSLFHTHSLFPSCSLASL